MGKRPRPRGLKAFCEKGKSGSKPVWEEELTFAFVDGAKYGLPGTDGGMSTNLLAYICQEHQFLSMFFAHKLHPFSQKERMVRKAAVAGARLIIFEW